MTDEGEEGSDEGDEVFPVLGSGKDKLVVTLRLPLNSCLLCLRLAQCVRREGDCKVELCLSAIDLFPSLGWLHRLLMMSSHRL